MGHVDIPLSTKNSRKESDQKSIRLIRRGGLAQQRGVEPQSLQYAGKYDLIQAFRQHRRKAVERSISRAKRGVVTTSALVGKFGVVLILSDFTRLACSRWAVPAC
jgi:hypothetical protein